MNARTPAASLVPQRLAALREAMSRAGADAAIIPSADPHLSEYLPERWQGRQWLSGFTGSVGTLVVTQDFAGLWVDGRYWVQAEAQLADTGIEMMKIVAGQPNAHIDWLASNLRAGACVGEDSAVVVLLNLSALGDSATRAQSHWSGQTAEDADARNAIRVLAFQDNALSGCAGG